MRVIGGSGGVSIARRSSLPVMEIRDIVLRMNWLSSIINRAKIVVDKRPSLVLVF